MDKKSVQNTEKNVQKTLEKVHNSKTLKELDRDYF